ncbi:MAG: ABC transporter substrate-binding protein, partial [Coriobacteriia bacterium]|nr:ABC transporter substrate-binding protein [Coriobacteriia bacterium]
MTKRLGKTAVATLSLGLVFAMALTGCAPKTDTAGEGGSGDATKGGTLSYYIGEPAYIDPYNTQESEGT